MAKDTKKRDPDHQQDSGEAEALSAQRVDSEVSTEHEQALREAADDNQHKAASIRSAAHRFPDLLDQEQALALANRLDPDQGCDEQEEFEPGESAASSVSAAKAKFKYGSALERVFPEEGDGVFGFGVYPRGWRYSVNHLTNAKAPDLLETIAHTFHAVGIDDTHPPDNWPADCFWIECLAFIANHCKPTRHQLVEIPQKSATGMFFQAQDEEVIAAAIDPRALVALAQQPDIAPIVGRSVVMQQINLQAARLSLEQLAHDGIRNEFVSIERSAGRFVAGPNPKRELIGDVGPAQFIDRPALPRAMKRDQPFGHHEGDGECVSFGFLELIAGFRAHRHAPQNAFIIQAGFVPHEEMTELMRGGEALDVHWPFGGNEHTRSRRTEIGSQQALERP